MRARISTRYVVGDAGMQDELIGWALQWHLHRAESCMDGRPVRWGKARAGVEHLKSGATGYP